MRVSFEINDLVVPTLFISVATSRGANVFAGRWEGEVANAPRVLTFNLEVNNDRISGTLEPQRLAVLDGKTMGQTIRFRVKSADGLRTITFTGILSGDAIEFIREVDPVAAPAQGGRGILGAQGPRTFVARRVAP